MTSSGLKVAYSGSEKGPGLWPPTFQYETEWPVFAWLEWICELGKRNRTPPCSSPALFFEEKNGVHRGKISVVDMVFLVFIGFLYPPPAWKGFSLRPEKFSKRYSFGGGCVPFFLLCVNVIGVISEPFARELRRWRVNIRVIVRIWHSRCGADPWTQA